MVIPTILFRASQTRRTILIKTPQSGFGLPLARKTLAMRGQLCARAAVSSGVAARGYILGGGNGNEVGSQQYPLPSDELQHPEINANPTPFGPNFAEQFPALGPIESRGAQLVTPYGYFAVCWWVAETGLSTPASASCDNYPLSINTTITTRIYCTHSNEQKE